MRHISNAQKKEKIKRKKTGEGKTNRSLELETRFDEVAREEQHVTAYRHDRARDEEANGIEILPIDLVVSHLFPFLLRLLGVPFLQRLCSPLPATKKKKKNDRRLCLGSLGSLLGLEIGKGRGEKTTGSGRKFRGGC